ncbi:MAG: hypothetical protein U1F36_04365 [Planctomycetota bacterium]
MIAKLLLCAALFQDPVAVVTPAGDPVALRVEAIPGVRVRAAWLALPLAPAADIDGAAMRRLFAECLRASLPPATAVEPTRVIAVPNGVWVGRVFDDGALDAVVADCRAWLQGELRCDDATLELARDRAVLAADDDTVIRPGPILRGRALRALGDEDDPGALRPESVAAVYALRPADLRARFRAAVHTRGAAVVVLGGEDVEPARSRLAAMLGEIAPREPGTVVATSRQEQPRESVHERVDGPFVLAAIPLPAQSDPDHVPFLVAAEVLRARAVIPLGDARGNEAGAAFPPVVFDPLVDSTAMFLERRGRNGAEPDAARAEIDALLRGLSSRPPDDRELSSAVEALRIAAALPPYDERMRDLLASNHSVLLSRARVLLCDGLRRIPTLFTDPDAAIDTGAVRDVIARRFAPPVVQWFTLLAAPSAPHR